MLHIAKASNEGVCFCECDDALMAVPDQLDCPWCGCGWLLTCAKCGKAFTFGRGVEVEGDLEAMVREDLAGRGWKKEAVREMLESATEYLRALLEDVEEGREYVYLDGAIIPADAEVPIEFDGVYARHELWELPHVKGRSDPDALHRAFEEPSYWLDRRVEDEGEESD
jgi:hypothetical protein